MASATITIAAGNQAGAQLRHLAHVLEKAASPLSDANPTGASVTCTISDSPSSGIASVIVAGGGLPTQPTYLV